MKRTLFQRMLGIALIALVAAPLAVSAGNR